MTPQEKARELVDKFWALSPQGYDRQPYYKYAKKCAVIATKEMSEELIHKHSDVNAELRYGYWQQVKQEIEKL